MAEFIITEEEKQSILRQRELKEKRQNAQPTQELPSHCDPKKVQQGRIVEGHPMFWFESEIFRKIGNLQHQKEHKKIYNLGMPIQAACRDRVYHILTHLDVLWNEGVLSTDYKARYEKYKEIHNIGDDNLHPEFKEEGVVYSTPNFKRRWDKEITKTCTYFDQFEMGA